VRRTHRARGRKGFPIGEIEHELGAGATTPGTKGVQLVEKAWIQRRHDLLAAPQQPVEMVALGNRFMHPRLGVDDVAFQDCDRVKGVGEDPGRHQSWQGPPDDHRMLTKVMCHTNLLSVCRCGSVYVLQASVSAHGPMAPPTGSATPRCGQSSHPTGRHTGRRPMEVQAALGLRPMMCQPPYEEVLLLRLLVHR